MTIYEFSPIQVYFLASNNPSEMLFTKSLQRHQFCIILGSKGRVMGPCRFVLFELPWGFTLSARYVLETAN